MAVDARRPDLRRQLAPNSGFKCDVCRKFVTATDHGVCPSCGREPLARPQLPGATREERIPWLYVAGVAFALIFLALLAW